MAISYVGMNAASGSTVNLPAFQAGDLAILLAYRHSSATAPDLPAAGWTNIATVSTTGNSGRISYRVLQAGDTSVTSTNQSFGQVIVLRGQKAAGPIGVNNTGAALVATVTVPALTVTDTGGAAWLVALAGQRSTGAGTDTNAKNVSGMTTRSGAVTNLGLHTKENNAANWSATAYDSATTNADRYCAAIVEVLVEPAASSRNYYDHFLGSAT